MALRSMSAKGARQTASSGEWRQIGEVSSAFLSSIRGRVEASNSRSDRETVRTG